MVLGRANASLSGSIRPLNGAPRLANGAADRPEEVWSASGRSATPGPDQPDFVIATIGRVDCLAPSFIDAPPPIIKIFRLKPAADQFRDACGFI